MEGETQNPDRFGIYIHWPFCEARCPYCDFNTYAASSISHRNWKTAYVRQLRHSAAELPDREVSSVYFGGGTPSLMAPETVSAILREIADLWQMAPDAEITAETNPSSAEASKFERFRGAGVNRISIGVQSLRDGDLRQLGRLHSAAEARDAFEAARKSFDKISIDLIYGRQYQGLKEWESELTEALGWQPEHLSLYQLTIEENTAFGERLRAGRLKGLPSEDLAAAMYESTLDLCEGSGFPLYEISNFAMPGAESRHNLLYWRCEDYLGIGPGAHGRLTIAGQRAATETFLSPRVWLSAVSENGTGECKRDWLDPDERASEYIMMSLRLAEGTDLARYDSLGTVGLDASKLAELEDEGLISLDRGRLRASRQGLLVLNALIAELISNKWKPRGYGNGA